jgi:hypothetical protein
MRSNRTTEWEATERVGEITTTLSFAVEVVDAFTGGRPTGTPTVSLADRRVTAVRNPSGFHLFVDLETDPVEVVVDGSDRYFDERLTVYHSSPAPDGASAVEVTDRSTPVEIELTPTPAFQFSPGATTVRGTVVDDTGSAVPDAAVSLDGFAPTARTTTAGEFALVVPVTAADVVRDGDGTRVADPTTDPTGGTPGNGPGNGSSSTESGSGRGNGSPGSGRGNGPPENSSSGNGPPPADETRPDPRLVVRHPDGTTVEVALHVDPGRLTVLRIEISGGSLTVDRLGVY